MTQIKLLSETLANQIAAGEVIENPASVVKELVENSIDANSTKIDINIVEGGLKEITVIDNGDGIPSSELALAFERHATSKIQTKRDLFKVQTLGFRGEALAAISSVSKVILTSATENSSQGATMTISDNKATDIKPASGRKGTEVNVLDLFYLTPTRYKYTKDLKKEVDAIINLVNRFAMSYPNIRFQLKKDGNILLQTNGNGDIHQVLARIYGLASAKKLRLIKGESLDFQVSGYISLPEFTRASKKYITIILNGRYIKSVSLNKAVIEGYGSKLMIGKYPLAVLKIDFDPSLIDVNVHPTKQEVRLSKEAELQQLIKQTIQDCLAKETLIPSGYDVNLQKRINKRSEQMAIDFSPTPSEKVSEDVELYQAEQKLIKRLEEQNEEPSVKDSHWALDDSYNYPFGEEVALQDNVQPKQIKYNSQQEVDAEGSTLRDYVKLAQKDLMTTSERFPHLEYFGQMHGTYLFAQNETGMYIIDQHAAQERIKYEDYRVRIGQVANDQQQLLLPLVFNFSLDEALKIESGLERLQDLGLHLEHFGQNSFILHTHPTWITENIEQVIQDLLDLYLQDNKLTLSTFREATAIMMSCKKSIKANHHLNDLQARQLISDLGKCKNPFNCPHGRPVLIHLTNYDMERMFKRIQDPH